MGVALNKFQDYCEVNYVRSPVKTQIMKIYIKIYQKEYIKNSFGHKLFLALVSSIHQAENSFLSMIGVVYVLLLVARVHSLRQV